MTQYRGDDTVIEDWGTEGPRGRFQEKRSCGELCGYLSNVLWNDGTVEMKLMIRTTNDVPSGSVVYLVPS